MSNIVLMGCYTIRDPSFSHWRSKINIKLYEVFNELVRKIGLGTQKIQNIGA